MSKIITPTIGRKVWYRPSKNDLLGPGSMQVALHQSDAELRRQPLDATIIAVWGPRMVNVLVTDSAGHQFPVLSCDLLQPGEEPKRDAAGDVIGRYVEWMPYQQAQAAV